MLLGEAGQRKLGQPRRDGRVADLEDRCRWDVVDSAKAMNLVVSTHVFQGATRAQDPYLYLDHKAEES
jgi:hypothetical protein